MRLAAFALGMLLASAAPAAAPQTVTFTATDAAIPNPERGYYRASPDTLDRLNEAFLRGAFADGFRLVYARINLEAYRDAPLPKAYLDQLGAGFATARASGVKLIVRATYNYPRGETQYRDAKDAPLDRVLQHLEQIKPLLRDNADVIAFVQAGFVGAWGEWHTSSNGLAAEGPRTAIKDALLDAVPQDRFVQFRYPPYIRQWLGEAAGSATRIGFHNDCFLASQTDVGTYSEDPTLRAAEQADMANLGDAAPYGGETCNPADDPDPTPRGTCEDILREGESYNLTYLNAGYYRPLFHDAWSTGGCAGEVARRMGYRFSLVDANLDRSAVRGKRLSLGVTIRNQGWARLYNPRKVEVVLHGRETIRLPVDSVDPRAWLQGTATQVSLGAMLPAGMTAGRYEVMIAFPDADPRLADDPRYAIRPANAEAGLQRWHPKLAAFSLGIDIAID